MPRAQKLVIALFGGFVFAMITGATQEASPKTSDIAMLLFLVFLLVFVYQLGMWLTSLGGRADDPQDMPEPDRPSVAPPPVPPSPAPPRPYGPRRYPR